MPKQIILSDEKPWVRSPDGGEHPLGFGPEDAPLPEGTDASAIRQRAVHVGWSKDRHVEVGVTELEPSTEAYTGAGHFTSLSRQGCNDLIRAVRRARDAAFGRDE